MYDTLPQVACGVLVIMRGSQAGTTQIFLTLNR